MKKTNLLKTVMISAISSFLFSIIFYVPIIYFIIKNEQASRQMVKDFVDGREQRKKLLEAEVLEKVNCIRQNLGECNIFKSQDPNIN